MRKKERKPLYMLLIYITFMVIPIFPIFFAVLTKKIFGISLNEDIIFTLDYLALFLITMTLYGKDFFKSFSYFKTNTIRKIGTILLLFFASAVLSILLNQIVDFQTKDTANNMSLIEYLHSNSIIVGIFIVGFCGPVVEEIVFRYILIGIFSKKNFTSRCNACFNDLLCCNPLIPISGISELCSADTCNDFCISYQSQTSI